MNISIAIRWLDGMRSIGVHVAATNKDAPGTEKVPEASLFTAGQALERPHAVAVENKGLL